MEYIQTADLDVSCSIEGNDEHRATTVYLELEASKV